MQQDYFTKKAMKQTVCSISFISRLLADFNEVVSRNFNSRAAREKVNHSPFLSFRQVQIPFFIADDGTTNISCMW